jgi:uncharacterized repeat protein (TIGR03803 family)
MHTTKVSFCLHVATLMLAMAISLSAQTEKIIHTFSFMNGDAPTADGFVADSKGNLYGTSGDGGTGWGSVFELSPNSNGSWTETVIYSFSPSAEFPQEFPQGGLIIDAKGNLYGTTLISFEGLGAGTAFELLPGSNGNWTLKSLYNFDQAFDGVSPRARLAMDKAGNLYGTTEEGGTKGFGTVFELVANADGSFREKILHNFTGKDDGGSPIAGVVIDGAGNLYGMAELGGVDDYGVIYQIAPAPNSTWTEHIVHSFPGGNGGTATSAAMAIDKQGNLYAAAAYSLLELSPTSGGAWTTRNIHIFMGGNDGASAGSALTFDSVGNLYGMTFSGGMHMGTVFKLSPGENGTWTEQILHSFVGGKDGRFPQFSNLVVDTKGIVYGTTSTGGASGDGVAFEITP